MLDLSFGETTVAATGTAIVISLLRLSHLVARLETWMKEHEKTHVGIDRRLDGLERHQEQTDERIDMSFHQTPNRRRT